MAGKGGTIGPALDNVGLRRTPEWMMQHFREPQAVTPGTVMPQFGFTEEEARALTDFLVQLREQNVDLSLSSVINPLDRGHETYRKYGCAGCHGADGKGGVPNPNAKTAQLVPDLIHVADGYTKDELKERILKGQREIPALDPNRAPPPLYMPPWGGIIKDAEVDDLVAYLLSLKPKGEESGF